MLGGACYPEHQERCPEIVAGLRCVRFRKHAGSHEPDPNEVIREVLIDALDQIERKTYETETQQIALEALKRAGYR